MSTLAILLSAFVLSVVALLVFIWSQRSGLFERSAQGAEVIFAPGEIGRVEEPSVSAAVRRRLQATLPAAQGAEPDGTELLDRRAPTPRPRRWCSSSSAAPSPGCWSPRSPA